MNESISAQSSGPNESNGLAARRLVVRGSVQGVGYRWSMVQVAQKLALGGWVRNHSDGTVEAVVVGPHGAVAAIIHWASGGPSGARVEQVEVEERPIIMAELEHDFEQRSTI